jgi:hypothetical protein
LNIATAVLTRRLMAKTGGPPKPKGEASEINKNGQAWNNNVDVGKKRNATNAIQPCPG